MWAIAARTHLTPAIEISDLYQAGMLAAIRAARTWRPDGGKGLISYCIYKATFAMVDLGQAELPHLVGRDDDGHGIYEALDARNKVGGFGLLGRHVDALPERQREILRLVYVEGFSQADVGRQWHVSRERIRQLHDRALRVLRVWVWRGWRAPSGR